MATLTEEERDAKVEAKQQEAAEQKEQKEAEKSEHEDKYFVVHGGTCVCDKAEVPTTEAEIVVTKNTKLLINSDDKKFAATEEDTTMKPPTATYGKCTLKPSSSGNLPCAPAFMPKWEKAYDKKTVDGKKILTELSTLQCTIGGKITIKKHGQEDSVVKEHAENTDEAEQALINTAIPLPVLEPQYPPIETIVLKAVAGKTLSSAVKSNKAKKGQKSETIKVKKVVIRLYDETTFIANPISGNTSLTSWAIYEIKDKIAGNKIFTKEQIGVSFQNTFLSTGTYRVEGYGSPKTIEYKNGITDKNYPDCSIDIEVIINKLDGTVLQLKDGDAFARQNDDKVNKLRKGFPATFEAKFLLEPNAEELENLNIYVTDGSGNHIETGIQSGNSFTFTPPNSDGKYKIEAKYTNPEGKIDIQSYTATSESAYVYRISHGDDVIRPETPMSFKVTQTQFKSGELTSVEAAAVKWNLNGQLVGKGNSITISGNYFLKEGDYVVEAFVKEANATGKNPINQDDDWNFKVAHNDVVSFICKGQPKVGKKTQLKVDKFLMSPIEGEKVVWNIFGLTLENSSYKNPVIDITPPKAGIESITCKIGYRKGVKQSIDIKQAKLVEAYFVDNNGIKIQNASWEQKVNIYLKTEFLIDEEINIQVYDQDYMSGNDPVYFKKIKKFDGNLINFKLDKSIKVKTGNWGRLYFKVTAPHLTLKNGDTRFPEDKLTVDADLNIKNALIGEENGSKKHTLVDYDDVSWFYANTTGIKDVSKIKIEIWQAVTGFDDDMKVSLKPILSDDGVLKAKIDWKKIPKIKSLRTVYIQVKDQNNTVIYDADGSRAEATLTLQSTAIAVKMVENKAAVVVGTQALEAKKDENKVCECEARVKAFMRMLRVGEGTDSERGYTTQFSGKQFSNMNNHPHDVVTANGYSSSAAGAYQIMSDTYDGLKTYRTKYSIMNFNQESQDKLCLVILKHSYVNDRPNSFYNPTYWKDKAKTNRDTVKENKAKVRRNIFKGQQADIIQLIIDNKIDQATLLSSLCWASLPDAPYGQPTETKAKCKANYDKFLKEELTNKQTWKLHLKEGFLNEFGYGCCKGSSSVVENGKWRMPIDNPMLCLYSQGGGDKPWHGSFGKKIRDNSANHSGNDLLAEPNTKVYACLKSKVHKIYTSTSMAGNVVVLKVLDMDTFKKLRNKNYLPKYQNKGELLEDSFNHDGDVYLTFWHLSKNNFFKVGDIVNYNDVIGLTGISGWNGKNFTTRNPHLHFEVSNVGSAAGLKGKCNPSVYFKFKTEDDLSKKEIEYQNKLKNKEWK